MSDLITNNLATNISNIQALQRVETPGACLTLTRSATLAITTAGTTVTWQTETRNNGFVWSGTTITVPTTGYYGISMTIASVNNFTTWFVLNVNSIAVAFMTQDSTAVNRHSAYCQRYFVTGDAITISLFPSINVTLSLIAENSANESPILHIVQMTGSQT